MTLKQQLEDIVGAAGVSDDLARRELFSEDIWQRGGHVAALVAVPRSVAEISAIAKAASVAGVPLSLRGAGMEDVIFAGTATRPARVPSRIAKPRRSRRRLRGSPGTAVPARR